MIYLLEWNAQDKYLNWALENELRPIDPKHYFLYHAIFAQYVEKGSLKKVVKKTVKNFIGTTPKPSDTNCLGVFS